MNEDLIIAPIGIIMIFGVLPFGIMYYANKIKTKKMDTLVKIMELGGSVDEETLKMLSNGGGGGDHKSDYRNGLIWLAVGLPLALGIYLGGGIEGAMFGSIPIFVGIAYLISGKYRLREPSQ